MVAWLSLPQMILYTALYLLSQWLMPHITPQMLADFKACGGLPLFAMGLKMAKIRQIAILDLLPACYWLRFSDAYFRRDNVA